MSSHFAIAGWLLGTPSGANRRLLELLRATLPLLAADERVTVLHGAAFAPPFAHPQLQWRRTAIPAGPMLARALAERQVLPGLLRELGATVLDHGMLPATRVPCPLLQTLHDLRDADGHGRRPRWLARAAVRAAVRRAAHLVVPSEHTRSGVLALAPGAAVTVIANGVAAAPSGTPAPFGPLLHVGHLEPRKNLGVLLLALALLPIARRPSLWLVGRDAGAGPCLRKQARTLRLEAHVQFRGAMAEGELASLYAAARAVVVPSVCEGFGLCALEGLAHGRPVLVANCGALPEVVGDCGLALPPHDAAAWAAAIDATAHDDDTAATRRRDRAALFPWSSAAARWLAVCRAIASSRG